MLLITLQGLSCIRYSLFIYVLVNIPLNYLQLVGLISGGDTEVEDIRSTSVYVDIGSQYIPGDCLVFLVQ